MDNTDRKKFAYLILIVFTLVSIMSIFGFDAPTARGQAILGFLVSIMGIVVVYAIPVVEESS